MKRSPILLLAFCLTQALSAGPFVVQNRPGYNSWPMVQAIGKRLVCAYSRGKGHDIVEGGRGVYARVSDDFGKTWSNEVTVVDLPSHGESVVGKGLDATGAALLWVRAFSPSEKHHDLYRTKDGIRFEKIATPVLSPKPIQITDVFSVPGKGLMALWFSGWLSGEGNAWGTLVSADGGRTWTQRTVERVRDVKDLATEPSAVWLGRGRILAIARTERGNGDGARQYQLTSEDSGETWKRLPTNIGDVCHSTPSLVADMKSGMLFNYYYERGKGLVKRRVAHAESVFAAPETWSEPDVVGAGSTSVPDSGNVNATAVGRRHFLAYYSGQAPNTSVCLLPVDAKIDKKGKGER